MFIVKQLHDNNFDSNLIFSFIESYNLNLELVKDNYEHINDELIALLRLFYNDSRIIKLLLTEPIHIKDTVYSLKKISEYPQFTPIKKPISLYQLHEEVNELATKIKIGNLPLKQREDVIKLNKENIGDNLTIKVPMTHFDLVELGEKLSFCIGNGYYTGNIINQKALSLQFIKATKHYTAFDLRVIVLVRLMDLVTKKFLMRYLIN